MPATILWNNEAHEETNEKNQIMKNQKVKNQIKRVKMDEDQTS
jgi:hypothetical protein